MKLISKIASIALILLLLVNMFSLSLVNMYYELNKEEIAENRCINKEITEVQCYGKCFLDKTIKLAQESKAQDTHQSKVSILTLEYLPIGEVALVTFDLNDPISIGFAPIEQATLEGYAFLDPLPPSC